MQITVIKRDGSKEPFDPAKIIRVGKAAGLSPEKAEEHARIITAWAEKQGKPELTSLVIRDQMIIEMVKVDPQAAEFYKWYQKTLEK